MAASDDNVQALLSHLQDQQQSRPRSRETVRDALHHADNQVTIDALPDYITYTEDESLDEYDRRLLQETYPDRIWQASHDMGRITLPNRAQLEFGDVFSETQFGVPPQASDNLNIFHGTPQLWQPRHETTYRRPQVRQPLQVMTQIKTHNRQRVIEQSSPYFDSSSPSAETDHRAVQPGRSYRINDPEDIENQVPCANISELGQTRSSNVTVPSTTFSNDGPLVQGILLVAVSRLPDRFRCIFPWAFFNAVQSKCFEYVYFNDDNFVMSAPTGSGKTVIFELGICRLLTQSASEGFKVVYMAPTKSLCAERARDWENKFRALNLSTLEMTGDTASSDSAARIHQAQIIVTTPEKWDSLTRKWKDYRRLMMLVKLLLIDEVHMLKDTRGAVLEVVVSRMKSIQAGTRIIALSATIPNMSDVASWLGRNSDQQDIAARSEIFGEEFRPVKLVKHVHGMRNQGNAFQFDKACNASLPGIITKHSCQQPIMIFCFTRKACVATAKMLKDQRMSDSMARNWWPLPAQPIVVKSDDLKELLAVGVAYHHAGLDINDRTLIENGYLRGDVSVICCTSTLAVGVNLPCHLVIIKNTVAYQEDGLREYSDLEIMQMLGRAGRPQFPLRGAVAVILTSTEKVEKYKRLAAGQETLESFLHLKLIEHMNAEIGLGTIVDLQTARKWLKSTFLHARLAKNPKYYKLSSGDVENIEDHITSICQRDINALHACDLIIEKQNFLRCTPFGDAMARYYVQFRSMQLFLQLPERAKISEILSVLVEAQEFQGIRYRATEQGMLKALNSDPGIKFPLKDITNAAQKRSIIIQAELGNVEIPANSKGISTNFQHNTERSLIFNNIHRLIRCIIDCKISLKDALSVRNSLELARSLSARVWDGSYLTMKQIPNIGPVTVRKLIQNGISSLEEIEEANPARLNMMLGKQHFGEKIQGAAKAFPRLRVTVTMLGCDTKSTCGLPEVRFDVDIGFLNETPSLMYAKKPVFICFLAERSDNVLIEFRRMKASAIAESISLATPLSNADQYITCYVMCDDLAGTLKSAELRPKLPTQVFPASLLHEEAATQSTTEVQQVPGAEISRRRSRFQNDAHADGSHQQDDDLFGLDEIDEADLLAVESLSGFRRIEEIVPVLKDSQRTTSKQETERPGGDDQTRLRADGRYDCNHLCKNKNACRHLCCRDGLDKPPRKSKNVEHEGLVRHVGRFEQPYVVSHRSHAEQSQKPKIMRHQNKQLANDVRPAKRQKQSMEPSTTNVHQSVVSQPEKGTSHEPNPLFLMGGDNSCPVADGPLQDFESLDHFELLSDPPQISAPSNWANSSRYRSTGSLQNTSNPLPRVSSPLSFMRGACRLGRDSPIQGDPGESTRNAADEMAGSDPSLFLSEFSGSSQTQATRPPVEKQPAPAKALASAKHRHTDEPTVPDSTAIKQKDDDKIEKNDTDEIVHCQVEESADSHFSPTPDRPFNDMEGIDMDIFRIYSQVATFTED